MAFDVSFLVVSEVTVENRFAANLAYAFVEPSSVILVLCSMPLILETTLEDLRTQWTPECLVQLTVYRLHVRCNSLFRFVLLLAQIAFERQLQSLLVRIHHVLLQFHEFHIAFCALQADVFRYPMSHQMFTPDERLFAIVAVEGPRIVRCRNNFLLYPDNVVLLQHMLCQTICATVLLLTQFAFCIV